MQGRSGTSNVAFSDSIVTSDVVASQLKKYYDDIMMMKNDEDNMIQLHRYDRKNDIRRVKALGEGCFTNVFLVRVVAHQSDEQKPAMALKCLDHKKIRSPQQFFTASRDLIGEANLLSELDHPNIVKIHGVCNTSTVSESFMPGNDGGDEGFFMVMDVMEATLKQRLVLWRNDPDSYKKRSIVKRIMNKKGQSSREKINPEGMKFRIETVAVGVAEAMNHIHKRDIVLRNLSPENIGFNEATGKVCLFDFGSARNLKECEHDVLDICGTPNYMAPEVMRAEGYSLASDVYSFAMVLYEICSLRKWTASRSNKPFTIHNGTIIRPQAFDSRPSLDCIPCRDTQYLIEDCWCSDPMLRPNFEQICSAISDVVLAKKTKLSPTEDRTVSTASEHE